MKAIIPLILLLSFFCIIIPRPGYAAPWAKAYGGSDEDWIYDISETSDGGFIAAGYTCSFGSGVESNAWVTKLASDGSITWEKTLSGLPTDYISSIEQNSDGGYVMAGYTECFGAKRGDLWVIKLDSTGSITWAWRYGGDGITSSEGTDEATSIKETADGGYIVAGRTKSFGGGVCDANSTSPGAPCLVDDDCGPYSYCLVDSDAWVIKLAGDGSVIWQNQYGGSDFDIASSIEQTSDGGYIMAGDTWTCASGTDVDSDMMVMKLASDGSITWQKTFGDIDSDSACCVHQTTPDGGYILAGDTRSFTGITQIWILKLDGSGDITWQKTYGETWNYASSIKQTADGGYIVAGQTYDYGAGFSDILLLKLDSAGNISWQKTYGGSDYEWAHAVEEISAGGYIVGGRTLSFGAGIDDALLLSIDASGEIPDCSIMGISEIIPSDTSIDAVESYLPFSSTDAEPVITEAIVDEPSMDVESICPLSGTDSDADGVIDPVDNCLLTPNGPALGTCVQLVSSMMVTSDMTCSSNDDCVTALGEICDLAQGDCNGNGCGDACECYADITGTSGKVDLSDLVNLKGEFNQTCPPCTADLNGSGKVDLADLVLMKREFNRTGCPVLP